MIDFYTWATPNGMKVHILLEELGLVSGQDYALKPVRLGQGEQRQPEFQTLNPNGKIPVIVERGDDRDDGFILRESGAILTYLADKHGRFTATSAKAGAPQTRATIQEWIMFQMSLVGPVIGQLHHFQASAPEPIPYALTRFKTEANRLLALLDQRLSNSPHLAGPDYTIADICTWPWVRSWIHTLGKDIEAYPTLGRWYEAIAARAAVKVAVDWNVAMKKG